MTDYWVSYYVPTDRLKDFELHSPWWVSGYTMEDRERSTVVAAIRAENETEAAAKFKAAFDSHPEFEERFIEPLLHTPFSDRFPKADWMEWSESAICACGMENCK